MYKNGLTPENKRFAKEYAKSSNGTKSVVTAAKDRKLTYGSAAVRASRLLKNDKVLDEIEYQKKRIEVLATKAVNNIADLLDTEDDNLKFSVSKWSYEQVHGQATKKNITLSANASIEDVLASLK